MPIRWRSAGMWPIPSEMNAGPSAGDVAAVEDDGPCLGRRSPPIASTSSFWPLPSTPAMPTISPERISSSRPRRRPAAGGRRRRRGPPSAGRARPAAPGCFSTRQDHGPADHHPRQVRRLRLAGVVVADHLPSSHHGDPVGDLDHFAELVRDEDDGLALLGRGCRGSRTGPGLLRGQDRGWLIQDQQPGAPIERLQDLDPLLQADRKSATRASGWTSRP